MPQLSDSPFAQILAQRALKRQNRVAPVLHIPARVRDTGAPSDAAIIARDKRVARDANVANVHDARNAAYYPAFTTDPHLFNAGRFTTKRGN